MAKKMSISRKSDYPLWALMALGEEEKLSGTVVVDFGSATGVDGDFQAQRFDYFVAPGIRTVRRAPFDTISQRVKFTFRFRRVDVIKPVW